MKKITFTCLSLMIICFSTYAQKTSFGFKAGVSSNFLNYEDNGIKSRAEKTGTLFGFVAQFQLAKNLAFQPNLLGTLKGGHINEMHYKLWNVELPLNLLYTNSGFFAGGGPNLSYSLDGRVSGPSAQPDGEVDLHAPGEMPGFVYRRFEFGANVLMGFTCRNGISLSANFTHGLTNLYDGPRNDMFIRTKSFGFALGYMF